MAVRQVGADEFHELDRRVMGLAFGIHNELGRAFDERIYQAELAHRIRAASMPAAREVLVRVTHDGFAKDYYLDLVVADGVIYELKTAEMLTGLHERQLIHYLLLTGCPHGKLVNFRPLSVESRFVSTRLTPARRRQFVVDRNGWLPVGERSRRLEELLTALLHDWGTFLEADLYREAVVHFLGGEQQLVRPVDVVSGDRVVGRQNLYLLDDTTAFHISAVSHHADHYEKHLRRLLAHTQLDRMQWANLDKDRVVFRTLGGATGACAP